MNRGSPRFEVHKDVVDGYRNLEISWTNIAALLSTTTKTLGKWRKANNYEVTLGTCH